MMENNKPSSAALNLLKLSSSTYQEVYEKHGESEAVSASLGLFSDYIKVLGSESRPKLRSSNFMPQSSLNPDDLDEFIRKDSCKSGKFESCSSKEITDEDAKSFAMRRNANSSDQVDFDEDFDKLFGDFNKSENIAPTFSKPLSNFHLQDSSGPPRKRFAEQGTSSIIDKINNSFSQKKQIETPRPAEPWAEPLKEVQPAKTGFIKASDELKAQNYKKYGDANFIQPKSSTNRLGLSKSVPAKSFKSPVQNEEEPMVTDEDEENPLLKGIEPEILAIIKQEVVHGVLNVSWDDIAGLKQAKEKIQEAVVMPLLRPDIFQGLRVAPKGILLFGPPGTGKTLIGKCVASQANATFFSISASSLTSKWIGQGEKLVRALFRYARAKQPAVIFFDEIDSLLTKRSETEHESSRRLKTEFLIQFDGADGTSEKDKILFIAATNRPEELDEAARRRFSRRLYIPLPDFDARKDLVRNLLKRNNEREMTESELNQISQWTDGYSGDDLKNLCQEAAMEPVREMSKQIFSNIPASQIRRLSVEDFRNSLGNVKASVSQNELGNYIEWNKKYGSTT